ncbi:hypothetical protein niasHS_009445 [Heterodera schachtii]|uniref:Protein kinase domain-containing protein n=1 Tax=Heterodera schachtii TaxID=97005 RepID=A0ABD2J1Q7_HETSC
MVKSIINSLVAFHKVGIHLDIKPMNLIVFERNDFFGKVKTLKLIDFDGSVLYSDEQRNMIKINEDSIGCTKTYAAPELLQQLSLASDGVKGEVEVTPKMDIWAAGITIFTMAFFTTEINALEEHQKIGELFRSAKLNSVDGGISDSLMNKLKLPRESVQPGSKDWWQRYLSTVAKTLSVWQKMPEIAFLSANMLNIDPKKRMTAQGIVAFLEGKCKPTDYPKNHLEMALFGEVSAEKLLKLINYENERFIKREWAIAEKSVLAVILETANSRAVKKDNKKGAIATPAKGKAAPKGAAKEGIKKDAKSKGKGKKDAKGKKAKPMAAVKAVPKAAENAQKGPSSAEVVAEENNLDTEAVDDLGAEESDFDQLAEDELLEDDAMDGEADEWEGMGEETEMDSQMAL